MSPVGLPSALWDAPAPELKLRILNGVSVGLEVGGRVGITHVNILMESSFEGKLVQLGLQSTSKCV